MAIEAQPSILQQMKAACLAFVGRDMALFDKARKVSIDHGELLERLVDTAFHTDPSTDVDLIRAVALKVLATSAKLSAALCDTQFTDHQKQQFHCLPLYEAIGTAADGLDPHSLSKANTIIAQLAHGRVADGTLSLEDLKQTMIKSIEDRKGECSLQDKNEIDKIIYLTDECAKIRRLPYDISNIFRRGQNLVGLIEEGEAETPEYKRQKKNYDRMKKTNVDLLAGSESLILNSRYPARVLAVRMRDTLDDMQMLWGMEPFLDNEAKQYLRLTAQHAMGMYYPILERLGWKQAKEDLGFLVMEILQPGEYARLSKIWDSMPDDAFENAKNFLENLAKHDSKLQTLLTESGIELRLQSRKKSIFSAWLKMFNDGIEEDKLLALQSLHDVYGVRFIVDGKCEESKLLEVIQRYVILITDHSIASESVEGIRAVDAGPGLEAVILKDSRYDKNYIAEPKSNGYRTRQMRLRFDFRKSNGTPQRVQVELQLRTQEMDDDARYGDAFHGDHKLDRYKLAAEKILEREAENSARRKIPPEIIANRKRRRIQMVLDLGGRLRKQLVQHCELPSFVTVRSRHGKCLDLPKETTDGKPMLLMDFVFLFSRALGKKSQLLDTCIGVNINGKELTDFTPEMLRTPFSNADSIEVLTSNTFCPNPQWADYCNLAAAKQHIERGSERLEAKPCSLKPLTRKPDPLALA